MSLEKGIATDLFSENWEKGNFSEALAIYYEADRPFWFAADAGHYYESKRLAKEAVAEYEHLIDEYLRISPDFLPLPKGPRELFVLGEWYANKDKDKARKYLELYLSAGTRCRNDPAYFLEYKAEAERLLDKLESSSGFGYVV